MRFLQVVPGRVELPTSTLSVWRSNQLSYRTGRKCLRMGCFLFRSAKIALLFETRKGHPASSFSFFYINKTNFAGSKENTWSCLLSFCFPVFKISILWRVSFLELQKGGVPAAPSGTATLLRLSPNYQYHSRPTLAVTAFKCSRLSWLDGRCVQGPGTYSPRHG